MTIDRFSVAFEATGRQRSQLLILEFGIETRRLMTEFLQRELHAAAPLAEAGLGFSKHPRHAIK